MSSLQQADVAFLSRFSLRLSSIGIVLDCARCGAAIPLSICRSDLNGNSGKPMAKHSSCSFYRWFPQLLAYPNIINLICSSNPSSSYSPTFASSQPVASTSSSSGTTMSPFPSTQPHTKSNGKKPRKRGGKCVGSFCQRPRALRCTHAMCLTHCTNAGGCAIHPVDTEIVHGHEDMSAQEEFEILADEEADMTALEPGVDSDDTGHGVLRQALALSLTMRGLEFPVAPPPHIPSFHDLLTAPVVTAPSLTTPPPMTSIAAPTPTPVPVPAPIKKLPRITQQLDPLCISDLNARAQREVPSRAAVSSSPQASHLWIQVDESRRQGAGTVDMVNQVYSQTWRALKKQNRVAQQSMVSTCAVLSAIRVFRIQLPSPQRTDDSVSEDP